MGTRIFRSVLNMRFFKLPIREIHSSGTLRLNPNNVTEVRIPVPWGHVAGKWWGDTNEQPILALHGWQDNAGTFDPLLEKLCHRKPVLAIDSPGHGFSSHYPDGMLYRNSTYIMTIRRIVKYFNWDKKITFLGHSEGGVIAFVFSAIYPELVNALITLDVVKPFVSRYPLAKYGELIDTALIKSKRDSTKNTQYSLEDIQNRWVSGTKGSLTADAAKILIRRGAKLDTNSGKYTLTRDPKLKIFPLQNFAESQSLELASNIKCHYLVLKFSDGKFLDYSLKNSPNFISTVSKAAKSFEIVPVEGTHHAHLNNPERVAPIVDEFLNKVNNNS